MIIKCGQYEGLSYVGALFHLYYQCSDGTNAWRDNQRPTAILNEVCGRRGITPPVYHGDSRCTVADHEYEVFPEGKCNSTSVLCEEGLGRS